MDLRKSLILLFVLFFTCSIVEPKYDFNLQVEILNGEIRKLSKRYNIDVIDTYSLFLENSRDGENSFYTDDGLHISKLGYENWINNGVMPYLELNNVSKIGMIGNSITSGIDLYTWDETIGGITNWQVLLNRPIENYGIGGNTSIQVLDRLDTILKDDQECYFLLIGINDVTACIPIWKIVENIEMIIVKIKDSGSDVVVQLVFPVVE